MAETEMGASYTWMGAVHMYTWIDTKTVCVIRLCLWHMSYTWVEDVGIAHTLMPKIQSRLPALCSGVAEWPEPLGCVCGVP